MFNSIRILTVALGLLIGLSGFSQSVSKTPTADEQWAALKIKAEQSRGTNTAKAGVATNSKAQKASDYLTQATQLQEFIANNPNHAGSAEARQMAAVALSMAAMNGDETQDQRRAQLILEVRNDLKLPVEKRFEAVAWSKQVEVARSKPTSRAAFLSAHEKAGRQLIEEFPSFSGGYESLLGVARDSEPSQGRRIAQELVNMAAPEEIKSSARLLVERFDLVGRSLSEVLATVGAESLSAKTTGRVTIVYSWSSPFKRQSCLGGQLEEADSGGCIHQPQPRYRQRAWENAGGKAWFAGRDSLRSTRGRWSGRASAQDSVTRTGLFGGCQGAHS